MKECREDIGIEAFQDPVIFKEEERYWLILGFSMWEFFYQ